MMKRCGYCAIFLAVILPFSLSLKQADNRQARIAWLSRNAVVLRSIDPTVADDDFADLRPLMTAIGDSRIVVLGEQSHGDGATFLAKARLIKFLHQRMGFDVLAWESGLFDCYDMDSGVRDPAVPIEDAIRRGVYPIWGKSAQVRPVFEYARSVAGTRRPLEMIGFDPQFSGMNGSGTRWRDAMISFIDKADPSILPAPLRSSLLNDLPSVLSKQPADIRFVAEKWRALPGVLDAARTRLESTHGVRDFALMRRTADEEVFALEGLARFREAAGQFNVANNNWRDQRMAETLVWLANEQYKGRRMIVWAAIFHSLHEPSAIKLPPGGFSYESVLTMGQVARNSLDDAIYTVAFTAAEGKAGNVGSPTLDLEPPDDGSFEDLCLALGHRFLFVNLRIAPKVHWLRRPIKASPLSYSAIETDWTRQVDAFVFTRTMFPSTKGPMVPEGAVLTDQPSHPRAR
jgi:erythromycin esterase